MVDRILDSTAETDKLGKGPVGGKGTSLSKSVPGRRNGKYKGPLLDAGHTPGLHWKHFALVISHGPGSGPEWQVLSFPFYMGINWRLFGEVKSLCMRLLSYSVEEPASYSGLVSNPWDFLSQWEQVLEERFWILSTPSLLWLWGGPGGGVAWGG